MTWAVVFVVIVLAIVATAILSLLAYLAGLNLAVNRKDDAIRKAADKQVDALLAKEIGKTVAGINDGKTYNWSISFDTLDDGSKCNVTRFGVNIGLEALVNLVTRRAIEWGCDITKIEIERCDVKGGEEAENEE